jgi:hypothetical protein
VPQGSAVPNPGSITSDPEEIKKILFEFQSKLCAEPTSYVGFDPNFFAQTENIVSSIPKDEIGMPSSEQPPSISEVTDAIRSLVNHEASGLDMLFNECLKAGGDPLSASLTSLFQGSLAL